MAISEVIFPEGLPCVSRIDGYALAHSAALVRTPFDAGNARQRRWNIVLPTEIQLAWRVANDELQLLVAWLNTYGYDWFQLYTAGIESSAIGAIAEFIDVRLTSDISVTLNPIHFQNWWNVRATAVYSPALPEPATPPPGPLALAFWFDFTDASTMYKDDAGTHVSADGDDVMVIRDKNGTAVCLLENVPWLDYRTGVVAGNSVGRSGDGSTDNYHTLRLTTAPANGIPVGDPLTMDVPFSNGKNAITVVVAIKLTADTTLRQIFGDVDDGFMYMESIKTSEGDQNKVVVSNYDTGTEKRIDDEYDNDTWAVLSWIQDDTEETLRHNGNVVGTIACTGPAALNNEARLGRGFVDFAFRGDISEIALFNVILDPVDLFAVETLFADKVGLVI